MPAPPAPHASHDHSGGNHASGVDVRETRYAASLIVSITLPLPLDHATAPQARSLSGRHREAEEAHVAKTVTEAQALSPRLSPGKGCWKDTCSGPLPHRRDRLFSMSACAHVGGTAQRYRQEIGRCVDLLHLLFCSRLHSVTYCHYHRFH